MSASGKEYYWRGPITDGRHARSVIARLGWIGAAWGTLLGLIILIDVQRSSRLDEAAPLVIAAVHVVPWLVLLVWRSRIAAGALLVFSAIGMAPLVTVVVNFARHHNWGGGVVAALFLLAALAATASSWRALRATMALRRAAAGLTATDNIAAQFD